MSLSECAAAAVAPSKYTKILPVAHVAFIQIAAQQLGSLVCGSAQPACFAALFTHSLGLATGLAYGHLWYGHLT